MLNDLVQEFYLDQTARGNSSDTLVYYRYCLGHFMRFTGDDFDLKDLTPRFLKQYVVHLANSEISSISVQSYVRGLRAFLKWLYDEKYIDVDLCLRFKLPKASRKVIDVLSDDEIKQLLSCFDGSSWLQLRNRLIVLLMLDSGLRLSEVVNLRRSDIYLNDNYLIVTGKGDRQRIVPFGKSTHAALVNYLLAVGSAGSHEFLFIKLSKVQCCFDQITDATVKNMFRRLRCRSGIDRLYPHLLRHTFATRFLENGGNIYALQSILGHSSLEMVKKYLHLSETRIRSNFGLFSPVDNVKRELSLNSNNSPLDWCSCGNSNPGPFD